MKFTHLRQCHSEDGNKQFHITGNMIKFQKKTSFISFAVVSFNTQHFCFKKIIMYGLGSAVTLEWDIYEH